MNSHLQPLPFQFSSLTIYFSDALTAPRLPASLPSTIASKRAATVDVVTAVSANIRIWVSAVSVEVAPKWLADSLPAEYIARAALSIISLLHAISLRLRLYDLQGFELVVGELGAIDDSTSTV